MLLWSVVAHLRHQLLSGAARVIPIPGFCPLPLSVRCAPTSGLEPGLTFAGDLASGPLAALGQSRPESLCRSSLRLQRLQAFDDRARDITVAHRVTCEPRVTPHLPQRCLFRHCMYNYHTCSIRLDHLDTKSGKKKLIVSGRHLRQRRG